MAEQLVSTALTFLGSGYDPARRNGAQFLAIALRVRCILAEFERQGGQSRLLLVLRATLILLRMPSSGDARMEKQVIATHTVKLLSAQKSCIKLCLHCKGLVAVHALVSSILQV